MVRIILFLFLLPLYGISQSWMNTHREGGPQNDNGRAICKDPAGNVYFAMDSSGMALIKKYDQFGNPIWSRLICEGFLTCITTDNTNYIYAAGGGTLAAGINSYVMVKYDFNGNSKWFYTETGNQYFTGITYSPGGFLYLTCYNGPTFKKFDTDGTLIWTETPTLNGSDIDTDMNGNVYVTGYFYGTKQFDNETITSSGQNDIFTAKYDGNGNLIWLSQAGGIKNQYSTAISVTNSGECYVAGNLLDTTNFGSTIINGDCSFVANYSASGTLGWVLQSEGGPADPQDLLFDSQGNIIVAGNFSGSVNFQGSYLTSSGLYDVFVAKVSNTGNVIGTLAGGGPTSYENLYKCWIDGSDNLYITGSFDNTSQFGSDFMTSVGSRDAYYSIVNVSLITSFEKSDPELESVIYPNPANGSVTIDLKHPHYKEILIFNIQGQLVLKKDVSGESKMHFEGLYPGTYFFRLVDVNDDSEVFKLLNIRGIE